MRVQVLYFDGCPNHETLLPHLRALLRRADVQADVELLRIDDEDAAARARFLGSPTVRIDGEDVEPGAAARTDFGVKCRLFATPDGLRGVPADAWVLDRVDAAARGRPHQVGPRPSPSGQSSCTAGAGAAALATTSRQASG